MTADGLPDLVAAVVVGISIVAALMVAIGVTRLARQPGVLRDAPGDLDGAARITAADRWTAVMMAVWIGGALLATFVLGNRSALVGFLYIVGLAAIGYGLVTLTETGRRLLAAVPQSWLIGAQMYRIVGGVFLIAATYDAVPRFFAIPAGWGDLITGTGATLVATWWAGGASFARRAAWIWNVFGFLDLVVAVGIGSSLLAPPAAALFGGSPYWLERAALGFRPFADGIFPLSFPLALVATFIVPLSILLHALSMRKLALGGVPSEGVKLPESPRLGSRAA